MFRIRLVVTGKDSFHEVHMTENGIVGSYRKYKKGD